MFLYSLTEIVTINLAWIRMQNKRITITIPELVYCTVQNVKLRFFQIEICSQQAVTRRSFHSGSHHLVIRMPVSPSSFIATPLTNTCLLLLLLMCVRLTSQDEQQSLLANGDFRRYTCPKDSLICYGGKPGIDDYMLPTNNWHIINSSGVVRKQFHFAYTWWLVVWWSLCKLYRAVQQRRRYMSLWQLCTRDRDKVS